MGGARLSPILWVPASRHWSYFRLKLGLSEDKGAGEKLHLSQKPPTSSPYSCAFPVSLLLVEIENSLSGLTGQGPGSEGEARRGK